jgi:TrmH family RNA methyltransferase
MAAASKRVTIPMAQGQIGRIESLNAAAAAAVCLFERRRQQLSH